MKKTILISFCFLTIFSCSNDHKDEPSVEKQTILTITKNIPLVKSIELISNENLDVLFKIVDEENNRIEASNIFNIQTVVTADDIIVNLEIKDKYKNQYEISSGGNILSDFISSIFNKCLFNNELDKIGGNESDINQMLQVLCDNPNFDLTNAENAVIPLSFQILENSRLANMKSSELNDLLFSKLNKVNDYFNNAKIEFIVGNTNIFNVEHFPNYNILDQTRADDGDIPYDSSSINIYIADYISPTLECTSKRTGVAQLPDINHRTNRIFIEVWGFMNNIDPHTRLLTHELGHTFSLFHNFQSSPPGGIINCISNNCLENDDTVCDTQDGDENLDPSLTCDDNRVVNMMSYSQNSHPQCTNAGFTKEQNERMRFAAEHWYSDLIIKTVKHANGPTPANGATDISLNGNLSFTAGENTPTGATFKVYFDTNTEPTTVYNLEANTTSLSYSDLEENTQYYWKVETINTNNEVLATSPIWSFTTLVNQSNVSPATPNNPKNGDVNVPLNGSITWLGGDGTPPGSAYRLYFDSNPNPQTEVSVNGQSHTYSNLSENTIFYWKVETISSSGDILATSPVWSFTTESNTAGEIYEGNLKLTTQAQIDSFNYTVVTGNLIIQESTKNDILNLNGLSNLTSVGEYLTISYNDALTSLSGLSNLTSVSGDLTIIENAALTSLNGLSNLTSVNGYLHIGYNAALTSLSGLSNLTSVGENLIISYNAALISLSGLSNLTSIDGDLLVFENNTLASLNALSNLTSIKGSLDIYGSRVTSLDGLHNLTTVGKDLYIRDNFDLTSLNALSNISSLKGLSISGNSSLVSLDGLQNLVSINGDFIKLDGIGSLFIRDNAALTSLNGLSNLTSVSDDLDIRDNDALTSLNGLENLIVLGGSLKIGGKYKILTDQGNDTLTDFCGISQLINNGQIEQNEYLVEYNAFNPTYQDIIDGNCSQ